MHRRLGLFLVVSVGMVLVVVVPAVRGALSGWELFRVDEVEVEGIEFLTVETVRGAAAIPDSASVWDEFESVVDRLVAHPGIRAVRVGRRLPGTVVLHVEERQPVALLPDPVLVPIDEEGRRLPVSPVGRPMDLPLVQRRLGAEASGGDLTPAQIRMLTSELSRLRALDPGVLTSVSEIALGMDGDVLLHLGDPRVVLRYGPPILPGRLEEALVVLDDAIERHPDRTPVSVDLRFADQVVVRFADAGERR